MTAITLNDESTWPGEVLQCLDKHKQILYSWESENSRTDDTVGAAKLYDQAHADVYDSLSKYSLRGYHCTRLTQHEITVVQNDGLSLQNRQTLTVRIDRLLQDGLLTPKMADDLKNKNEANAPNRQGKLWFCFFPPHKSGEDGIGRFFILCWLCLNILYFVIMPDLILLLTLINLHRLKGR